MHAGFDGSNFEFNNSVVWYSKEQMAQYELVITAAETARRDGVDLFYAYGSAVNPNGNFSSSTDTGIIRGPTFPVIPNSAPLGQSAGVATPDHGIPCILREVQELAEWPVGSAVVASADGRGFRITESNKLVDPDLVQAWADEQETLARSGKFFFSITHFVCVAHKQKD